MNKVSLIILVLVSFAFFESRCHADLILEFGSGAVVGESSFTGMVGQSIITEIYLTQVGETVLNSPSTGLIVADFIVSIDGTNVVPIETSFGPGFVDDQSGNTGISGSIAQIAAFESSLTGTEGVTVAADGISDNSILLGTVTFQIQPGASGTYSLTVSQAPSFSSFSLAGDIFPIAVSVFPGNATLQVTAVPEPSSLVGFGLASVVAMVWRRRRIQQTPVDASTFA